MTISTTTTFVQLPGNGSAVVFAFPMKCFNAIDVMVGFITTLGYVLQTSGYTVTNVDVNGGGNVVFTIPPPLGTTVDIRTLTQPIQPTEFANLGTFLPENHTEALDRVTRAIQDLMRRTYTFGIHGPDTEVTPWPALPAARAGGVLTFDQNNLPALGIPTTQIITTALLAPFLALSQTAAEITANVTPSNLSYQSGPFRYGALGNGVANDAPAWATMGLVGGYHFVYDGTYLFNSKVQIGHAIGGLNAFLSIEGSTRQNTTIKGPTGSGLPDYLFEVGANAFGPNENVGLLRRLRFTAPGGAAGLLHMNTASDMWHLDELLFQSSPCPAIVLTRIFDSNYSNIDILNCGATSAPASQGAAVVCNAGTGGNTNNIYFRGLRIEQCPSGSMYVDTTSGPIYWITGKVDQGFMLGQVQPPITVDGSGINQGYLSVDNISITGHTTFAATVKGSLRLNNVRIDGGSGVAAHILDQRAWAHIDNATFPTVGQSDCAPTIGSISLIGSSFGYAHPSQTTNVTPAVIQSKIPGLRLVAQVNVTASSPSGSNTTVQTTLTIPNNQSYNGCYLVHNATGTQAAGQAGARRKILTASASASQLIVQGNWAPTIDNDWSIEYCGGHYTPRLLVDDIQMDPPSYNGVLTTPTMTLFAVLQTGATIAGPAYAAAGGAAGGGATVVTLTASNFPANTDATGYYLVDEVTGEPFYINYGCDGASIIAVLYDRTADLNTAHTYSIVAGYSANIKQNGTSYEWTYGGKKKTCLISQANAYGFDAQNLPLWGIGTTGEAILLPYSASISCDMAAGQCFQINANNAVAFTINNPLNANNGDKLTISINNVSGGALGALTFGSAFRASAWVQAATGFGRAITFLYNGQAWKEVSRTAADVPN